MINHPLISVLIPVHNAGANLRSAVESIFSQTLQDFEIILVDDHSTDSAIQNLYPRERLRIFKNPGRGIVPALNEASKRARGKVFARMDADDEAYPHRFEQQFELLSKGFDIVGSKVELFVDSGELGGGYQRYQEWINQLTSHQLISENIFVESPLPHPTVMIWRDVFNDLGGYRDVPWAEDYDLWLRAYNKGYIMAKPEDVLLRWRDSGQRLSRTDKRYSSHSFLACKANFLKHVVGGDDVVVWGTGPTGVAIHDALAKEGVSIRGFIDVHPRRVGGTKRKKPVFGVENVPAMQEKILVAVGRVGAREEIGRFLVTNGKKINKDFIYVA